MFDNMTDEQKKKFLTDYANKQNKDNPMFNIVSSLGSMIKGKPQEETKPTTPSLDLGQPELTYKPQQVGLNVTPDEETKAKLAALKGLGGMYGI